MFFFLFPFTCENTLISLFVTRKETIHVRQTRAIRNRSLSMTSLIRIRSLAKFYIFTPCPKKEASSFSTTSLAFLDRFS